ncbi:MAG: hypothetical protein ACOC1F_01535 [Myxococcota bacterium]
MSMGKQAGRGAPISQVAVFLLAATVVAGCAGVCNTPPQASRTDTVPDTVPTDAVSPEATTMSETQPRQAAQLMESFAQRTGLASDQPVKRYLWTDAFAVCNFLGLAEATDAASHTELAKKLIDQVHHTLGQHRPEDPRQGWLSGLEGEQAEEHPTRGGLRIGKKLPERPADVPFEDRLEWDRDGQYFHYLTKWMHALDVATRKTGEPKYNRWARELAEVAHRAFTYAPRAGGRPRMYWKMSIDLSRPLVPSMGHHDPLDGTVTSAQLSATAGRLEDPAGPRVADEAKRFGTMVARSDLGTHDPLGIGGLLIDAYRVQQVLGKAPVLDVRWLEDILRGAYVGLRMYAGAGELDAPASQRLAFRELGLAIGLYGITPMRRAVRAEPERYGVKVPALLDELASFMPLRDDVVSFWSREENRRVRTWIEHQDINEVMLATALAPEGCLSLP